MSILKAFWGRPVIWKMTLPARGLFLTGARISKMYSYLESLVNFFPLPPLFIHSFDQYSNKICMLIDHLYNMWCDVKC